MTRTSPATMGWLRAAVGVTLIAAPGPFLRLSRREQPTGASMLLLRTIGIRDLVLGLGTVAATRSGDAGGVRGWVSTTLASDSLDVVASLASTTAIGAINAVAAATLALLAVAGDVQALRSIGRPGEGSTRH